MSESKKVLLAVSGGIAAYKSAFLSRELMRAGVEVRVLMTQGARAFVQPLTFQALTGFEVHTDLLDETAEAGMGHIELARWADLILIAPASANTIARIAQGSAEDLLGTVILATGAPVLLAPAMNKHMWANPAVQRNCAQITEIGHELIEPDAGLQACGDVGTGRMPEPEVLRELVLSRLSSLHRGQALQGKRVLITAGPTVEAIDPVRYLSNHSTGMMGYALARACRDAGADVTLVSGPVALSLPVGVICTQVQSARDMLEACLKACTEQPFDLMIATAAVADYRTREAVPQKIKKSQDEMLLDLVKNPDVLATLAEQFPLTFHVGFAAETQRVEEYAKGKLGDKKLGAIVCNDVSRSDIGFGAVDNAVTLYFAGGESLELAKAPKDQIAKQLILAIAPHLN